MSRNKKEYEEIPSPANSIELEHIKRNQTLEPLNYDFVEDSTHPNVQD